MNFKLQLDKGAIKTRYQFAAILQQVACNFEQGSVSGEIKKGEKIIGSYELTGKVED